MLPLSKSRLHFPIGNWELATGNTCILATLFVTLKICEQLWHLPFVDNRSDIFAVPSATSGAAPFLSVVWKVSSENSLPSDWRSVRCMTRMRRAVASGRMSGSTDVAQTVAREPESVNASGPDSTRPLSGKAKPPHVRGVTTVMRRRTGSRRKTASGSASMW